MKKSCKIKGNNHLVNFNSEKIYKKYLRINTSNENIGRFVRFNLSKKEKLLLYGPDGVVVS